IDTRLADGHVRRRALRWGARGSLAQPLQPLLRDVVMRSQVYQLAVVAIDNSELAATETHRIGHDGVKHRLHISRRTGNHAQDLTRCRLLLVRLTDLSMRRGELFPSLCQFTVACLELL